MRGQTSEKNQLHWQTSEKKPVDVGSQGAQGRTKNLTCFLVAEKRRDNGLRPQHAVWMPTFVVHEFSVNLCLHLCLVFLYDPVLPNFPEKKNPNELLAGTSSSQRPGHLWLPPSHRHPSTNLQIGDGTRGEPATRSCPRVSVRAAGVGVAEAPSHTMATSPRDVVELAGRRAVRASAATVRWSRLAYVPGRYLVSFDRAKKSASMGLISRGHLAACSKLTT